MLSGAVAGIKMSSTIRNFIHTIERNESYMGNVVALREEVVRKIFNPGPLFMNEQPGPVTSTWPLIWNGLVQIDDDKLTFEFIERQDTDDKV